MAQFPRLAFLVSHTHWDREWYQTFHEFRINLTSVVRRVLDALDRDAEYRHFVLDGQSIILEDHLEVHPEDEPRLRRAVEQGKLSLGPWYILPDEFLVSGEATVRNLMLGHRVAARFGGVQKVGYMPDSFGHVAQIPQLLRLAGIDSFIYTRGNGDEIDDLGWEYRWRAPDGSEVLAINQCGGYCNAGGLGFAEIWHAHTQRRVEPRRAVEQVGELFAKMEKSTNGDIALLNNGCDHFPPQQDFARVLEALREAFPTTEFRHTSLGEVVDAVRAAGSATRSFQGELCGGKLHHILSGVWSARVPLKQRNDHSQTLLASIAEPLATYAHFCHGREYPAGALEYAWKLLLQNHPHDSICGCSTDDVHRDMEPRFDGVDQTADQSLRKLLQSLTPTFATHAEADRDTVLCLANPLPFARDAVVERIVVLQPMDYDLDRLRLLDEDGRSVPFVIHEKRYLERFWGIDYRMQLSAEDQHAFLASYLEQFASRIVKTEDDAESADCFLTLQILAKDLPALGHAQLRLTDRSQKPVAPLPDDVRLDGNRVENELVAATVHPDGSLDLLDKRSGQEFRGLNQLTDVADIGDEYDFCALDGDVAVGPDRARGTVEIVERTQLRATLRAKFDWLIPQQISSERTRRSTEWISCPTSVDVTLTHGSAAIEIDVRMENRAEDHRVQALFPADIQTETIVSDGHFYQNRRPLDPPGSDHWVQPHPGTVCQQEYSLLESDARSLAVVAHGLNEVQPLRGPSGAGFALTLLRCVGWLSRDDFASRRFSNAGPTIFTPDAQCLGPQRFRYAAIPFAGNREDALIKRTSEDLRVPVLSMQGVEDGMARGTSLLGHRATTTSISAIKRHVERDTMVVRLTNLTDVDTEDELRLGRRIAAAWRVDLLEERLEPLPHGELTLALALRPHEILTVEIAFA